MITSTCILKFFIFSIVQLSCSTQHGERPVVIVPSLFFPPDAICVVQPAKNVFGSVNITLAPACKFPSPPSVSSLIRSIGSFFI